MQRLALVGLGLMLGLILGGGLLAGCGALSHASPMLSPNSGGMMGRGMMGGPGGMGGMMGRSAGPAVPTAAPDDGRPVEQTITIVAQGMRFTPARVEVPAGQTVRFIIENRDSFAHNFVSAPAGIGERVIAGGATQSVVWTAPARKATYRAQCTYHPGMVLDIQVN